MQISVCKFCEFHRTRAVQARHAAQRAATAADRALHIELAELHEARCKEHERTHS